MSFIEKNSKYGKVGNKLVILAGLSAGLYPLIYLYSSNLTLFTSWSQFVFLVLFFICMPILLFLTFFWIAKKLIRPRISEDLILTLLNLLTFSGLIVYGIYGLKKKLLVIVFLVVLILRVFLKRYIRKVVKFQFLIALVGFIVFIPKLFDFIYSDTNWTKQKDDIENIRFKNSPNIYLIQPDGYIGLSEIDKGNYKKDNTEFINFLQDNNFTLYPDFRSNYFSTLSSNSSMFTMKHHYFNQRADTGSELLFARAIIVGKNPVLSVLKNNNYTSSLIIENSYLLTSRPKISYDYCNIDYGDISYLAKGFEFKKDVTKDLEIALKRDKEKPTFYFIERILPGHIATFKSYSKGKEAERVEYLENINDANNWLKETIELINTYDSNGLIIIAADHGGFVGYDYSAQSHRKPENRDNTLSMFSSLLAIKWPDDASEYDKNLNTSVNLFRIVFSYLGEDKSLLNALEEDKSFLIVDENAPLGIYEVIDGNREIVFKAFKSN